MMLRVFIGILFVLFAVILELWLGTIGVFTDIALAALIVFAFLASNILELSVFILCAVFLLNWQPAPSFELLVFALIPLAAYLFKKTFSLEPYAGTMLAVLGGVLLFNLFFVSWSGLRGASLSILADVLFCLLFASAAFWTLCRTAFQSR